MSRPMEPGLQPITRDEIREAAWRVLRFRLDEATPDQIQSTLQALAALDQEEAGDQRAAALVQSFVARVRLVYDPTGQTFEIRSRDDAEARR